MSRQRFSADWAKYKEKQVAAQREEQQRMAEYYARMTKEQEDRENAEARERFVGTAGATVGQSASQAVSERV